MPYKTRKVGSKYCVYKKDSGEKVGCTKGTKEALKKYLAALHIAEDELELGLGSFKTFFKQREASTEDAQDRCKRKADQVYGKKTSAYKSGAIVRCRKGDIWKKK